MNEHIPFLRLLSNIELETSGKENILTRYLPEILLGFFSIFSIIFWPVNLNALSEYVVLIIWICILALMLSLMIANLRTMLLPDFLVKRLAILVIVYQVVKVVQLESGSVLWSAILGGLLVGGIPYVLFRVSSGRWIGGGDVKLGFVAGLLLGWKVGLLCTVLMVLLILVTFLVIYIAGKISDGEKSAPKFESGILWTISITTCVLFSKQIINLLGSI